MAHTSRFPTALTAFSVIPREPAAIAGGVETTTTLRGTVSVRLGMVQIRVPAAPFPSRLFVCPRPAATVPVVAAWPTMRGPSTAATGRFAGSWCCPAWRRAYHQSICVPACLPASAIAYERRIKNSRVTTSLSDKQQLPCNAGCLLTVFDTIGCQLRRHTERVLQRSSQCGLLRRWGA
jgi:hypothetical protein